MQTLERNVQLPSESKDFREIWAKRDEQRLLIDVLAQENKTASCWLWGTLLLSLAFGCAAKLPLPVKTQLSMAVGGIGLGVYGLVEAAAIKRREDQIAEAYSVSQPDTVQSV